MEHLGTKKLVTKRLILRQFVLGDAENMFKNWANDREVTKYLCWKPHENVEETRELLESWIPKYLQKDYYEWAIILKEINEPIGSIAVVKREDDIKMVHIGYRIGKKWWNQGITSEALKALIKFFFEEVGINRIESRHDPNNPSSGKVMLKCGLKYEGLKRQADINNQGLIDSVEYGMIAEDYFKK